MSNIILTAETGSDIPAALAKEMGIYLVPMHVTMGDETLDDGSFPPQDVCTFYDKAGTLPKTSGCVPEDFVKTFARIREEHPGSCILHLAYSSVTTCSMQSAYVAAEKAPDIAIIDTQHVSAGQYVIVMAMARYLKEHPQITLEEAAEEAKRISRRSRMCFMPHDLKYLRAGGRVSNVAALVGGLLMLHPCIEVLDGFLVAKKKYRGKMESAVPKLIEEYVLREDLDRSCLWLIRAPGFSDKLQKISENKAKELGFDKVVWVDTGCVITTHGGPGAFGIVGFVK